MNDTKEELKLTDCINWWCFERVPVEVNFKGNKKCLECLCSGE